MQDDITLSHTFLTLPHAYLSLSIVLIKKASIDDYQRQFQIDHKHQPQRELNPHERLLKKQKVYEKVSNCDYVLHNVRFLNF